MKNFSLLAQLQNFIVLVSYTKKEKNYGSKCYIIKFIDVLPQSCFIELFSF